MPTADLHESIRHFNLDEVKRHLANGTDPNCFGSSALSPLQEACMSFMEIASYDPLRKRLLNSGQLIIEELINSGAHMNQYAGNDESILHFVSQASHLPVNERQLVSLLVKHGAQVNIKGYDDKTALHIAAIRGRTALCTILIEFGADTKARTKHYGDTPWRLARESGHSLTAKAIQSAITTTTT